MHYEIDFMTFSKYLQKNEYTYPDYKFELFPYKWYDLRWIFQKPAYWLLLKVFKKSENKITRKTHNQASIITLLIELAIAIKLILEIIKLFVD